MKFPARAWCVVCGHRDLASRMVSVQVSRQTYHSPAEYEPVCEVCNRLALEDEAQADERRGLSPEEWAEL